MTLEERCKQVRDTPKRLRARAAHLRAILAQQGVGAFTLDSSSKEAHMNFSAFLSNVPAGDRPSSSEEGKEGLTIKGLTLTRLGGPPTPAQAVSPEAKTPPGGARKTARAKSPSAEGDEAPQDLKGSGGGKPATGESGEEGPPDTGAEEEASKMPRDLDVMAHAKGTLELDGPVDLGALGEIIRSAGIREGDEKRPTAFAPQGREAAQEGRPAVEFPQGGAERELTRGTPLENPDTLQDRFGTAVARPEADEAMGEEPSEEPRPLGFGKPSTDKPAEGPGTRTA